MLLASCENENDLRLIEPRLPRDREIAVDFVTLLDTESSLSITLVPSSGNEQTSISALLSDQADIAFVSNNQPYTPDITTVLPLYTNVLHILQKQPALAKNDLDLFTSGRVLAGPPGSPSRLILSQYAAARGVNPDDIEYLGIGDAEVCPDVIIIFSSIMSDLQSRLDALLPDCGNYGLYDGFGNAESIGHGSGIDAATLLNPRLRAFVIPAGIYGDISEDAVVTLAVDKMLVARHDVPAAVIYDLIGEILRLQPALAAQNPLLFYDLTGEFKASDSSFLLHPGSRDYLERDAPSVYERYSGIAEVAVTVFVALLSGAIAGVRIYNIRRKNRIDRFYTAAIDLRKSINDQTPAEERRNAITRIRELETEAFELLVDEKLAADESFRIFITLSHDIVNELKASSAPDWSS